MLTDTLLGKKNAGNTIVYDVKYCKHDVQLGTYTTQYRSQ